MQAFLKSRCDAKLPWKAVCKNFFSKVNQNEKNLTRCIILLIISVYAAYSYNAYSNYKVVMNNNLQKTADTIENNINDIFSQHTLLIQYIGSQIAEHNNPEDLLFIKEILETLSDKEYNAKRILSWSLFDWVSENAELVVNQKMGIIKVRKGGIWLHKDRDYVPKAKLRPWTLILSPPDIGKVSQKWVIPAGFGIKDTKGNYLGLISMGFDVSNLNMILKERMQRDSASYIILDEHNNIVLKSPDNHISDQSDYYKNYLKNKHITTNSVGFLENAIHYDSIQYDYYKKMDKYPYTILTGFDNNVMKLQLFNTILPLAGELTFITIILLTLLYRYRRRYTETARAANKAKHKIIEETMRQLQWDIELIFQHSNILLKYFNEELKIEVSKSKQIEMLSRIQEAALSLQKFSVINLDMVQVDVSKLIKDVAIVHSHNCLIKNIYLSLEIQPNLHAFYGNELGLKQLLIGLISQTLESIPNGGSLKIKAFMNNDESGIKYLHIVLLDDGFDLSNEDVHRISEKFSKNHAADADLINFNIDTIMSIINLHNGSYSQINLSEKGKSTTLIFPYIVQKNVQKVITSVEEGYVIH